MKKKIIPLALSIFLTGCTVMPGMQNPDMYRMKQLSSAQNAIQPHLIPITADLVENNKSSKYVYRVAPGDILSITVWQHPEFNAAKIPNNSATPHGQETATQEGYLVSQSGTIYFPLIKNLYVRNQTVDEIRKSLTQKLRRYIVHPQIEVRVSSFRGQKIYILGEIKKTGILMLNDQALSITDAILMSGGMNPDSADPEHVYVIRGNPAQPTVYWLNAKSPEGLLLAEKFYLKPSDILYISSASIVRWNRVMNQLLPTVQTVWYTSAIINSNN
ncbi:MAG: polysaccharide biosynthesis/export family protein [Gammaproteobacteria bacterium]|nr:polysaccharide biosynthesis/export family protein [Gammaproteobacteria bacterium]